LIEARAREFGVPFVCADKTGPELTVSYVGQSRFVRGDGTTAAEAPATGEMVIAARLIRKPPRRVWVPDNRRGVLRRENNSTSSVRSAERKVTVAAMPTSIANQRYTGGMGESLFKPLADRGVKILLVNMSQEGPAEQLVMLANIYDIHAAGFPARADVYELGQSKVGCISGQWLRSFAPARALALEGAEILMYFDVPENLSLLRARAVENRVFVLGASERSAVVIDPTGKILAKTGPDHPAEAVVEIDLSLAVNKFVAPKTNVFTERQVSLYRY
jgi:predicted amidohydrolase